MELYHALPFFVYLLMNSFRDPVRNLWVFIWGFLN
jgi:hypothetical protein